MGHDRHHGPPPRPPPTHLKPLFTRLLDVGHCTFGENRVQETDAKWPNLRASFPHLELHLVGPLQTNKVRKAVALFDAIHSVDRISLCRALALECDRLGRQPDLFVQVNTGAEPHKSGVAPDEADSFLEACQHDYGLNISGAMAVPPFDEPKGPHFSLLAEIATRNGLTRLSMGMTADFPLAIEYGATHIRVGTAIFGNRPQIP